MKDFALFLKESRTYYDSIGKVFCPILGQDVAFNSKGFWHLRHDADRTRRSIQEQAYKLKLVPFAIPVIQSAIMVYDYKKKWSPGSDGWKNDIPNKKALR